MKVVSFKRLDLLLPEFFNFWQWLVLSCVFVEGNYMMILGCSMGLKEEVASRGNYCYGSVHWDCALVMLRCSQHG